MTTFAINAVNCEVGARVNHARRVAARVTNQTRTLAAAKVGTERVRRNVCVKAHHMRT
jgi:hypothetical protein